MDKIILKAADLSIGFLMKDGIKQVTNKVSFDIRQGEILGIVGESGSGKSVTALSILGLLSENARIIQGSIKFLGKELTKVTDKEYRSIRGREISMIFQEPMTSLNPVLTIGAQVIEMIKLHGMNEEADYRNKRISISDDNSSLQGKGTAADARQYVLSIFEEVGLKEPEKIYNKYPHQLSGGMRQRVMIAMAVILRPKLLIADEPTTALDVTLQLKLLNLIKKINKEYNISVLLISHDLSVIKHLCNRTVVMHNGRMIEQGNVKDIFNNPSEEYTRNLISFTFINDIYKVKGCEEVSEEVNKEINKGEKYEDIWNSVDSGLIRDFLRIEDLNVYYDEKRKSLFTKRKKTHAVKGVSFSLKHGEILGIVGESGSGKSSIVKAVTGLIHDYSGQVHIESSDKIYIQMVFQDPYGSLNPSKKIGWILQEPLKLHTKLGKELRLERVYDMLAKVGLSKEYADRYPSELSGGQRQRAAIALALMLNQKIILLDEPVSALDVTIQKQILKLLIDLKKEYNLSYIFITHDMNVVRRICDRVCVMYKGEIIEMNETYQLFESPKHDYTKRLLQSVI